MSDRRRNELERRYLEVMKNLAFVGAHHRADAADPRYGIVLRIRSLLALEESGPLRVDELSGRLGCAHAKTVTAMRALERDEMVRGRVDPADPGLRIYDLTGNGQEATDRFRRLAAERGITVLDLWESLQSDGVAEAMDLIRSLGKGTWIVDGRLIPDEP